MTTDEVIQEDTLELEMLELIDETRLFDVLDELEDELITLLELTLELTTLLVTELDPLEVELDEIAGGT